MQSSFAHREKKSAQNEMNPIGKNNKMKRFQLGI